MKKYKGIIFKVIPIVLVFAFIGTSVFGVEASFDKVTGQESAGLNTVKGATNTIWATVTNTVSAKNKIFCTILISCSGCICWT